MRIAIACLSVALLAASAAAADLKVPSGDYPKIQDAATAAQPGDRILVARGTYYENVTLNQSDVSILGKKAVWDGNIAGQDGTCLTVNGSGLVLQGFAFRNGTAHVEVVGVGTTIRKCTFTGAGDFVLSVNGAGASIDGCRFRGNAGGIYLVGPSSSVTRCQFRQTESDALAVSGDGSRVERNLVANTDGGSPIVVTGAGVAVLRNAILGTNNEAMIVNGTGATVEGNSVTNASNRGIQVDGSACGVTGNRVTACRSESITVTGDDARVEGNLVTWAGDWAINVFGDRLTVAGNRVTEATNNSLAFYLNSATAAGGGTVEGNLAADSAGWGFYLGIPNAGVRDNTALRCGSGGDGGFWIQASGIVVEGCSAVECDDTGFLADAPGVVFRGCTATNGSGDGFRLQDDDCRVEECTATGNGGEGLDNRGAQSEVVDSTFLRNRIDVASRSLAGASFAEFTGNTFVSGGQNREPEVD